MLQIIIWWILVECVGLAVLPVVLHWFKSLPDSGYPLSRMCGLVLLDYLCWVSGVTGINPYTTKTIYLMLLLLFVVCWFSSSEVRKQAMQFLTQNHSLIVFYEITGVSSFVLYLLIRSFSPDIYGAEKYMDFGILNALLRTRQFPPADPWLSGYPIHYYYYGHFLFATLSKMSFIPSQYTYNYSLATVFLLSMLGASSLGYNVFRLKSKVQNPKLKDMVTESEHRKAGLLTAFLLCMIGNLDGFFQLLEKGSIFQIDYWRSSRIIPDTINEFPFFSFLHGDLHAHLINLPVILIFLSTILVLYIRKNQTIDFMFWLALIVGTVVAINPWDMIPVFLLFLITFFNTGWKNTPWLIAAFVLGMGLFYSYLHAMPHSLQGIGKVTTVTHVTEFIIIFALPMYLFLWFIYASPICFGRDVTCYVSTGGKKEERESLYFYLSGSIFLALVIGVISKNLLLGFLCILILSCLYGLYFSLGETPSDKIHLRQRCPTESFILTLTLVAFIIFVLCEVVYLKDPFVGPLYRMNTIFKSYFTAWVLLAISGGYFAMYLIERGNIFWRGGLLTLLIMSLVYPIGATYSHSQGFRRMPTLNGEMYLQYLHPYDDPGIQWLQENVYGTPVILEYSGDAYSYSSRVSANTGLPTILGWQNHEGVWRNNASFLEERRRDVNTLFTTTDIQSTRLLLNKYHVRYIFIGELEKENYQTDKVTKWATLGRVVYSNEQTTIYEYP